MITKLGVTNVWYYHLDDVVFYENILCRNEDAFVDDVWKIARQELSGRKRRNACNCSQNR